MDLVRRFPLRRIASETELDIATVVLDELLDKEKLDADEADYLEILGDLIESYELEHHPPVDVPPEGMLRFLIESNELTQAQVAASTGIHESTLSQLLTGRRRLNRDHIEVLSRYFHVNPAAFLPGTGEHAATSPSSRKTRHKSMSAEAVAQRISARTGIDIQEDVLIAVANAFAIRPQRQPWRAFQEWVTQGRSWIGLDSVTDSLNEWGVDPADCGFVRFHFTMDQIKLICLAFAAEPECWETFRRLVEEEITSRNALYKEFSEDN